MHRVEPPADLIAQPLQNETFAAGVEFTAMHLDPGRFVDGHEIFVLVENRKHGAPKTRVIGNGR